MHYYNEDDQVNKAVYPRALAFGFEGGLVRVMAQLIKFLKISREVGSTFESQLQLLAEIDKDLPGYCAGVLKLDETTGRDLIENTLLGLDKHKDIAVDGSVLDQLQKLGRFLRWFAMDVFPVEHLDCLRAKYGKEEVTDTMVLQHTRELCEELSMQAWLNVLLQHPVETVVRTCMGLADRSPPY